jgi:hypothetical protein
MTFSFLRMVLIWRAVVLEHIYPVAAEKYAGLQCLLGGVYVNLLQPQLESTTRSGASIIFKM